MVWASNNIVGLCRKQAPSSISVKSRGKKRKDFLSYISALICISINDIIVSDLSPQIVSVVFRPLNPVSIFLPRFSYSGRKKIWTLNNLYASPVTEKWTVTRFYGSLILMERDRKPRKKTHDKKGVTCPSLTETGVWAHWTQSDYWLCKSDAFMDYGFDIVTVHYIMVFTIKPTILLFCMCFYFDIRFMKRTEASNSLWIW